MKRKVLSTTACAMATALLFAGTEFPSHAAPVAGFTGTMASMETSDPLVAGFSLQCSKYMASSELTAKLALSQNATPVVAEGEQNGQAPEAAQPQAQQEQPAQPSEPVNPFADIAIAQVNNYVNVRSEPSEESEILGKLYNNSAATVHETVDGWYQITSGTVTGYVKSEYVVVGNEELARSVGRRVATVNEDAITLFVRLEPSTEAGKLGMVASLDSLTVLDESVEGWVKVSIEEGEGYVSADYVTLSTEFVQAESKEEEAARLEKEERERREAEEAARRKLASQSANESSGSGSSGGGVSYTPPAGADGGSVAAFASQFVGCPYAYGGTSLTGGADCSGFVMSVYAEFGVGLPHSSGALRSCGYGVDVSEIQPGDIVCYSGHVAIYVGNNTIVHASTPSSGIKYTSPIDYAPILAVRRIF